MFWKQKKHGASVKSSVSLEKTFFEMVDRTQATIQFEIDGTIKSANANFLAALGYELDEIVGQHHSMFVDDAYAASSNYREFWESLGRGDVFTDQFPRVTKSGETIWIQATYAPVYDETNAISGVIKIASDVTERRRALEEIGKGLEKLASGDVGYRLPDIAVPDLKAIATSFNNATRQLSQSIGSIQEFSTSVEQTAVEVGQASHELAKRTETQAATLEETAAAIEELNTNVRSAADGATEVEASAKNAKTTAESGVGVVRSAIDAMSLIAESSNKIAQTISVIDDIAFQTNLLALNAGVEAARAGEAGRGFAVVASEVRSLAQKASSSSGEIKNLIEESSEQVSSGVSLVGAAGDELEKITNVVSQISVKITEIAKGVSDQAATLSEINTGITQLEGVTQQNAAMVEETSASSKTLAGDAGALSVQVAAFEIGAHEEAEVFEDELAEDSQLKEVTAA